MEGGGYKNEIIHQIDTAYDRAGGSEASWWQHECTKPKWVS